MSTRFADGKYTLSCDDTTGCNATRAAYDLTRLRDEAVAAGWRFRVHLTRPRYVEDWCPEHREGIAAGRAPAQLPVFEDADDRAYRDWVHSHRPADG